MVSTRKDLLWEMMPEAVERIRLVTFGVDHKTFNQLLFSPQGCSAVFEPGKIMQKGAKREEVC